MFGLFRRTQDAREEVHLELKSDAFFADPYPTYDALRTASPVHWSEEGFWFLSRHADVGTALGDARFSNQPAPFAVLHARNRDKRIAADIANRLVAFMDTPEHTALRGPIAKALRRYLTDHPPDFAQHATTVMAYARQGESFDFVSSCAEPMAANATCAMFGFPSEDAPQVTRWSYDFFTLFHAVPDAATLDALEDRLRAFRSYIDARLADAPTDTLTAVLAAEAAGRLSQGEVIDNIMLLVADAVGNVQAALAACVHLLLQNRQAIDALGTAAKVPAMIDECLRLESPGQFQGRITREPIEIGGRTIPARAIVLLGYGAANRDPAVFDQAEVFDPNREAQPHFAFGAGRHMCMGHAVVRTQLAAMLPVILASDDWGLAPDGPVTWQRRYGHRWLDRLPVRIVGSGTT